MCSSVMPPFSSCVTYNRSPIPLLSVRIPFQKDEILVGPSGENHARNHKLSFVQLDVLRTRPFGTRFSTSPIEREPVRKQVFLAGFPSPKTGNGGGSPGKSFFIINPSLQPIAKIGDNTPSRTAPFNKFPKRTPKRTNGHAQFLRSPIKYLPLNRINST